MTVSSPAGDHSLRVERWPPIVKPHRPWRLDPHLIDYDGECRAFTWAAARAQLAGLPGGRGLNIAFEAVDRHASGPAG